MREVRLNTDADTGEAQPRGQFVGYIAAHALFDDMLRWLVVVFVEYCKAHNGLLASLKDRWL